MTVTGAQLQEFLAGLDYPVSREDLVRWGQENVLCTTRFRRTGLDAEPSTAMPPLTMSHE
ncbi:DUF2795 domain-containing protein [Micromonospora tulbaghiae]|uniref:DUF2795 domain-containing protein n=1 Tax=Micromonospora tulbaghiae TaxID=479978 RepID=UPI003F4D44A3